MEYNPRMKVIVTIPGKEPGSSITWESTSGAVAYNIFRGTTDAIYEYGRHVRRLRKLANRRKTQRRARTGRKP